MALHFELRKGVFLFMEKAELNAGYEVELPDPLWLQLQMVPAIYEFVAVRLSRMTNRPRYAGAV